MIKPRAAHKHELAELAHKLDGFNRAWAQRNESLLRRDFAKPLRSSADPNRARNRALNIGIAIGFAAACAMFYIALKFLEAA